MAISWDELASMMPSTAKTLGDMFVTEGIGAMKSMDLTSDDARPSVAVAYADRRSGERFKVVLSLESDDANADDEGYD